MAMGSAFVSGGGLAKRGESYLPIVNYLSQRNMKPTGSRNSGGGGATGLTVNEAKWTPEERRLREVENDYRARHHGNLPPSTAELRAEGADRAYEIEKEKLRQSDQAGLAERKLSRDKFNREGQQWEKAYGLKEKESMRAGAEHQRKIAAADIELDREQRMNDHRKMMQAFMTGDYNGVMGWFIRNAPKGKDGSMRFPTFEPGEYQGTVSVQWPDAQEPETMQVDDVGKILMRLNPKYEYPKGAMEEANISATERKGRGLTMKDREDIAIKFGKGYAEGGPEFMEGYRNYGGGGLDIQGSGKSIVKTGTDTRTGRKVVQYADGTVRYADDEESDKNKKKKKRSKDESNNEE